MTGHLVLYKSFILLFLLLFSIKNFAQEYPEPTVNSLLKSGIDYLINQKYSQAKSEFEKLNNKFPALPLGKIYIAAEEIARGYDNGEEYNDKTISGYLNEAKEQAEKLLKKKADIWNYYFLGLAEGYNAYYEGLNGNWLTSLNEAVSSTSKMEECLKTNPEFYEAFSGIGNYKYWKSEKTEFLNWLPFIHDDRNEGIRLLEAGAEKSSYNRYLAFNSLIWIYIDKKNYNEAVQIAEKALQEYPETRFFKWGLARAYEDIDRLKSIKYYYDILNSYTNLSGMNHYNEILLKHLIAQQYAKLGDKPKALKMCGEILAIKGLSDFVKNKLGNRLERVKELQRSLAEN